MAVIPAKAGIPTFRTLYFNKINHVSQLDVALDLLEERKDQA